MLMEQSKDAASLRKAVSAFIMHMKLMRLVACSGLFACLRCFILGCIPHSVEGFTLRRADELPAFGRREARWCPPATVVLRNPNSFVLACGACCPVFCASGSAHTKAKPEASGSLPCLVFWRVGPCRALSFAVPSLLALPCVALPCHLALP